MPTRRRGQASSISQRPTTDTKSSSTNVRVTRLSQLAHQSDDHAHSSVERATKRRRTGSSTKEALDVETHLGAFHPSGPAQAKETPQEDVSSDDFQESSGHLKAQIEQNGGSLVGGIQAEPFGQLDPEMTKTISDIIDHSERFEQYCAANAGEDASLMGSNGLLFAKPGTRMKVESLPILDNLSSQILFTLAKLSYQDILTLVREPESEAGQEYSTVRSLFDHTKRVYSSTSSFLSPPELDLLESPQVEVLRKANLATFVSSMFGSQEIGFAELNDYFLETFVPENGRLLKAQGSLFLDLKTQAFISSMGTPERSKTELLYTLFPNDMGSKILARRPGARSLAPSEHDFVKRVYSRREILLADVSNRAALEALPEKYHWDDFLRDISSYVSKNFDAPNPQPKPQPATPRSLHHDPRKFPEQRFQHNFSVSQTSQAESVPMLPKQEDFVAKAARAAQIALQSHNISIPAPGPPQVQSFAPPKPAYQHQIQLQTNFQQYTPPTQAANSHSSRDKSVPSYGPLPYLPHVSQSAPTQVLYERARQAATTKATPTTRRAGLPSQRRPWTTDEENALMAGLDRVRGPHWSQILAMFGPGGNINESLKDRNQVQLKDKARNLKLFFLKSGIEVPYYLKYVTGDLKTRAPSQASRNEARERGRQQGEEDKAHFNGVQGIMALAGVNQQPPHSSAVNELQGFGVEGRAQSQDGLPSLEGGVEPSVDPNLDELQVLPVATDEASERQVGFATANGET